MNQIIYQIFVEILSCFLSSLFTVSHIFLIFNKPLGQKFLKCLFDGTVELFRENSSIFFRIFSSAISLTFGRILRFLGSLFVLLSSGGFCEVFFARSTGFIFSPSSFIAFFISSYTFRLVPLSLGVKSLVFLRNGSNVPRSSYLRPA